MTVRRLHVAAFALAALAGVASPARAQSQPALDAASWLVVKSGIAYQIRGLIELIESGAARDDQSVPPEMRPALAGAVKESFRPGVLQDGVVRRLATRMQPAEMDEVVAWLESPTGNRVTRAEEDAASAPPGEVIAWTERVGRQPPGAKRARLFAELTRLTRSVDAGVAMLEALGLAIMVGANAVQPREKQLALSELRERAVPPAETRSVIEQGIAAGLPYTYRDLSDAELEAHVAFLRSDLGMRYVDAISRAFAETLAEASVAVGPLLTRAASGKST